ncbi:MAG: hypothetical protein ACI87E_000749 [Mariniblastus sp.]|jgi:uncharacterized protein YcaQ
MIELSPIQAKRIVVTCQGLHKSNAFGRGDSAILECIDQLGYIQIDTISVIQRAHHHTFWTRIPKYLESHLDAMQRDRRIFEYWSHAAAYLPMQDYRFCLPYMNAVASGTKHWRTPDKKTMAKVMSHIRGEGPAKARDFVAPKTKRMDQWGGTKPAKIALEQLFIQGDLMISHRDGFQKVYDLPERVLPNGIDTSSPTTEEYCRFLIDRCLRSQGIATEFEMGYLRKGMRLDLKQQLQQMLADNEIVQVKVKGNPNVYYSRTEIVRKASSGRVAKKVHLLSPFDNLVIQRKRIAQLFDFDYQIECYVPEKKRKFGYFCLPILFGSELVGRLDPKVDRKNRVLSVRNLVIEKRIEQVDAFVVGLARKLKEFTSNNDCVQMTIDRCDDKRIGKSLARLLN